MNNSEHNSLTCILLQWMVRECFNVNTDFIFDEHMLRCMVGLDMEQEMGKEISPTPSPPDPLPPSGDNLALARPLKGKFEGYSFQRILVAVISWLSSPFCWAEKKLYNLCICNFGGSVGIPL